MKSKKTFRRPGAVTVIGIIIASELIEIISTDSPYRVEENAYPSLLLLGVVFFLLAFGVNGILPARGDTGSMKRVQISAFLSILSATRYLFLDCLGFFQGLVFMVWLFLPWQVRLS